MKSRLLVLSLLLLLTTDLLAQNQYVWTQRATIPAVGRHRASGCAVHNRGYIGLGHINNMTGEVIYDDWWEYDPATDSWTQRASFPMGPRYHAVAFGLGNYAYAGTGSGMMGDSDDMWRYDPATNTWTQMAPVPGGARSGAVAFVINGKGYVCNGDFQTDLEEYNPTTNTWTTKAACPSGGYSTVAAVVNNKAYVGIGQATTWAEYNPATDTWTTKAPLPAIARFGSGCFALHGWVYVISGSDWTQEFSDSWAYNPLTNQWVQIDDFPGQGRHYFVCYTMGNMAYGGTGTSGTNYSDFWQFGTLSGVEENSATETAATVYPNPIQTTATLALKSGRFEHADLIITDAQGREVKHIADCSGEQLTIDREGLAAGTYFYALRSAAAEYANGQLIVQ